MTKRSIFILWFVALALGAGVYLVKSGQDRAFETNTLRARGDTLLAEFPADKVATIVIKSADSSITLKQGKDGWTVAERDDYPANVTRINELLRTLLEVKVTQGIEAGPSYDARFGMDAGATTDEDHGLQLSLLDSEGAEVAALALGKQTESAAGGGPFGMGGGATGRHVRNRAEENAIYVTSETFPRVTATAKDWLREDFIKVEKIQSIAMAMPNKTDFKPWKLTRKDENADFQLDGAAEGETLDTTATNPLKSIFSYARFEDVAPQDTLKALGESPDLREVAIETVEGFTYTVRFAPAPDDNKDGDDSADTSSSDFLMTVEVKAEIPAERTKVDGESEEDAKTKDEAFATRSKELQEKLETEQKLAGRVFEVTRWTVDALTKKRDELIKKEEPKPAVTTPAVPAPPAPGAAATPPRRRVEAVTPPIAVPPLPKEADEPKTDEAKADEAKADKPRAVSKPVAIPPNNPGEPAADKPESPEPPQPAEPAEPKPADTPAEPAKPASADAPPAGDAPAPPERAVDQPKQPEIRKGAEPAEPAAPGQ